MSVAPETGVGATGSALTPTQLAAFTAQARRLGHDPGPLLAGAARTSYPVIDSVAVARGLLPVSRAQRRRRQAVFFGPQIAVRRAIGQGVHDRLEAAVFADGEIDLGDEAGAVPHFPFPAKATSLLRRRLAPGECFDVSVRGAEFGLDDFDDLLVLINIGELIMAPGASVVVRGNLLVLVVQRLECARATDDFPYHVGILPTPFSVDPRRDRVRAAGGPDGRDGRGGRDGEAATTGPGFLGPQLVSRPAAGAADGGPGEAGTAGGDGGPGASGGPSKLADIIIGDLAGDLVVHAGAGPGLDGGRGGDAGAGGVGGDGAPGVRALGEVIAPGRGGDGGAGGGGGRGGRGGSGGISSNVFVTVPPDQADRVRVLAVPSRGGRGGPGGRGGNGGNGGCGGAPAAHPPEARNSVGPVDGRAGEAGRDGSPGADGRSRPAPPVFVN